LNETLYVLMALLQSIVQTLLVSTMQVTTQITASHLPVSATVLRIPVTYVLTRFTRSWQSCTSAKESTGCLSWYIGFTCGVESADISIRQSSRQHLHSLYG
jgi:hypothetical protein